MKGQFFFQSLKKYLICEKSLIVMSDFNCVLRGCDKTSARAFRDRSTDALSEVIATCNLDDVAECLEGERCVRYTHFQRSSHARLDRIYVSPDVISKCSTYSVVPVSFSDHCLVECGIGTKKRENQFSWEMWKLNSKLITDDIFSRKVNEEIAN